MKKLFACLALAAAVLAPAAHAQQLRIATGKAGDTYSSMLRQLNARCSGDVSVVEVPSTGSNDNINQLVGNQVNAAFVQSDVLWLRARTEDLADVKTLLALHPEQVHIVALANSPIKEGGTFGFGAKAVTLNDITSLAGRPVGAAGGSLVTAQVIRLQSEIPFQVIAHDSGDAVLAALDAGKIAAAFFVGGAPLGTINKLGPEHKLLSIPAPVMEKLKGVYRPARLNYQRMNATGVATVATDALFVTRQYKTPKMTNGLAKLRQCALSSVDELKETTGTHPAWRYVDPANKGKWAWYDLPAVH